MNLQLVGDSLSKFADNEVKFHRVGGVNAPVGSRRELVVKSINTAPTSQKYRRDSTRLQLRRVGVGDVYRV